MLKGQCQKLFDKSQMSETIDVPAGRLSSSTHRPNFKKYKDYYITFIVPNMHFIPRTSTPNILCLMN